jgi:RNA polymerase sigma-70 factor (ECF subfamily)
MNPSILKTIIEQAQDGDEQAFNQLFDAYFERVLGYAFRRVLDGEVAQDIAGNVFLKLVQNINRFAWRHEQSFNGWIFRIASNEVNTYFRDQQRYRYLAPEESAKVLDKLAMDEGQRASVEAELDQHQRYALLHKAISHLNPREQEIIHLYYFEHLPHRAVAEALSMREGAVRTAMHRAQGRLEKILTSEPEFAAVFAEEAA